MSSAKDSSRGFRIFLDDLQQLQGKTSVTESSLAFEGTHCWITQRPTAPGGFELPPDHPRQPQNVLLNLAGAKAVVAALQSFIQAGEAGELMEGPDPIPEDEEDDDGRGDE